MHIDVVTIFPEMFEPVVGSSILKRAQAACRVDIRVHNLRDWTADKHRTVDDRPYGGGAGMVMKPEPLFKAVEEIEAIRHGAKAERPEGCRVALMAPQGECFSQPLAQELSELQHLVLICGHYEGVDERVREGLVDQEISIGDYVLTGGELPAMTVIDALVRLIPGVLGHERATEEESFTNDLLEYPQYTRPPVFRGMAVPQALRSGNHAHVAKWRKLHAVARTWSRRPDLISQRRASS